MKIALLCLASFFVSLAGFAETQYWVNGDQKELRLDLDGESGDLELWVWPAPSDGESQMVSCRIEQKAKGTWKSVVLTDESSSDLTLRIAGDTAELTVRSVPETIDIGIKDLSGTFTRSSRAEALARAKKRFEAADAVLNERYASVRKAAHKTEAAELRSLQRDWIAHRDSHAEDQPRQVGEGEYPKEEAISYWDSMYFLTETRIQFLKAWVGEGVKPGLDGIYEDFNGGTLTLSSSKGDKFHFEFEVVRGPTSHTGGVDGDAKRSGNSATWRDTESPAVIKFEFRPRGRIEVTGKETGEYHGARAYFDGLYFKTAK